MGGVTIAVHVRLLLLFFIVGIFMLTFDHGEDEPKG